MDMDHVVEQADDPVFQLRRQDERFPSGEIFNSFIAAVERARREAGSSDQPMNVIRDAGILARVAQVMPSGEVRTGNNMSS